MLSGINKLLDDGMRARKERREGLLQIYHHLKNYYYGKKIQKLIVKKQKELADNLGHSIAKNKETSYIETLINGTNITGDLLYDWDAKDGNPLNSGGGKFSRIVQSPLYKKNISDCEMQLFKKHADEISGLILNAQPKRIIDMGGGDGQKTVDILSLLDKASIANINITTKDISPYLGQEFVHNIKTWSQTSKTPIEASFIYENFLAKQELQSNKDKRMYLFSGGSIGQFEDDDIITIIQNMTSESVLGKRYALVTAFIAPDNTSTTYDDDVQKLLATYGSPDKQNPYYNHETHSTIEDWVMSGIYHHLGKQVENKLSFHVHYEDQGDIGGRVILGAKVIEPFTITIGNQTYSKQVGDFLPAIQSRRFSRSHITGLIRKAGCDIEAFDQEGGVGQILFHTPSINLDNMTPEKIQSWRRTAKLFGAGALIVGGMILGNKWTEYQREKSHQNIIKENITLTLQEKEFRGMSVFNNKDSNEVKYEYFKQIVDDYYENLYNRYDLHTLSLQDNQYIKELLIQWLLNKDETITEITISHHGGQLGINIKQEKISELIEGFIRENEYLLTAHKIQLALHPILTPYEQACKNTIDQQNKSIGMTQFSYNIKGTTVAGVERSGYNWLGVYTTRKGEQFAYGVMNDGKKDYIIGLPVDQCKGTEHQKTVKNVIQDGSILPKNVSKEYGILTIEYGKIIAEDYFKKPYVYKLSEIAFQIADGEPHSTPISIHDILSHTTYLIKDGYDFSWIIATKNTDVLQAFLHTYYSYLYKNDTSLYNQSANIKNIRSYFIEKYAPDSKDKFQTYKDYAILESSIFKELCSEKLLHLKTEKQIMYWIERHKHIFTDYLVYNTGQAGLLREIDVSNIQQYKKSAPDDILIEPSITGKIYSYKDNKGDIYEAKIYKGLVYGRKLIPFGSKDMEILTDKMIEGFRKAGIGPRRSEVQNTYNEAKKEGREGTIRAIESSRYMFRQDILNKMHTFNTEIGNYILQDRGKFLDELGQSISESVGPVGM